MYSILQAGKLEHDQLAGHLTKHGYRPEKHTPGLWTSDNKNISFVLWVDDFAVKYGYEKDVDHLIQTMQKLYQVLIDWSRKKSVGITIKWDYRKTKKFHLHARLHRISNVRTATSATEPTATLPAPIRKTGLR